MACQRCSTCGINYPVGHRGGCLSCGGATWYSTSGEPDPEPTAANARPRIKGAVECGSCGFEVTGYSKRDLDELGWKWHTGGDRVFVMCGECEERFAERRLRRAMGVTA